ncbi:MAG: hypothetical protein UEP57_10220 [Oscillospiraceae bacterium]|nr:hypothetical protein [Oscillospiraceae bacterium]
MEDMVKNRLGILRVYAQLDEEYKGLIRKAARAEIALLELERNVPPEDVKTLWEVIRAHEAANRRLVVLACEYMIFRSEIT